MNMIWRSIINPITLGVIVFLLMTTRLFLFYFGSDEQLIGIIPDDAFYYIQLAKHRVSDGFWTFDGTSVATGFHLLYAYILVVIFYFNPEIDWHTLYLLIGFISTISLSISAFLVAKLVGKIFDEKVQLMGVLPFLAIPSFIQSTSLVESWAVILLSSLGVYLVIQKPSTDSWFRIFVIFLIGILGSLARTDFGLLAGVLFVVSLYQK